MVSDPTPFDYWLEYLSQQSDLSEWVDTFDTARQDGQHELCQQLLREARRRELSPQDLATIKHHEGLLYVWLGDYVSGEQCYRVALRELLPSDSMRRAMLLGDLGMLQRLRGDHRAALDTHRQQLAEATSQEHEPLRAEAHDHIGLDLEMAQGWQQAQTHFEQALTLHKTIGDVEGVADSEKHLGLIAWRQGRLDDADEHLQAAWEALEHGERYTDLAQIKGNLGNLSYARGNLDEAEQHYRDALNIVNAVGAIFDKVGLLNNLGSLNFNRKDWEQAKQFYVEAQALAHQIEDTRDERDALFNLGIVSALLGRYDDSGQCYSQSMKLSRKLRDWRSVWQICRHQFRLILLRILKRLSNWLHTDRAPSR